MIRGLSISGAARGRSRQRPGLRRVLAVISMLGLIIGTIVPSGVAMASARPSSAAKPAALAAPTNHLTLSVRDLVSNATIGAYRWRIDIDDTGSPSSPPAAVGGIPQPGNPCYADTNPNYPAGCDWPSIHTFTGGAGGAANLVATGNQDDIALLPNLPNGKYFISVLATLPLKYRIGGEHFTMPLESTAGPVVVKLEAEPLPLGKILIQLFEDTSTNGQFDAEIESAPVTLPGHHFKAHIADVLGEVSTDWFGNPLCADYYKAGQTPPGGSPLDPDPNGNSAGYGVDSAGEFVYIAGTGGECIDGNDDGIIEIPNIGPNRYATTVVPPDGESWVQTTTLEGSFDWDTWVYDGWNGYDSEKLVNGGPQAVVEFGYVKPQATFTHPCSSGCGELKGTVSSTKSYLPPAGGDTIEGPVPNAYIALDDLRLTDDQLVWVGRADKNGHYDITGVPPSDYQVTFWDAQQNWLIMSTTITVAAGPVTTLDQGLPRWFSGISGSVFVDTNMDGKRQPSERGVPGFGLGLKARENSLVDAGANTATTDINGHYAFDQVYPYGYFTVLEAYSDLFMTTGVTYKTDNGPETTRLGAGVDISILAADGIKASVDWGVIPYPAGTNGGIVGEVVYAVTRNELDARLAAAEDYEPGIPGLTVNLYQPVVCTDPGTQTCDAAGKYVLDASGAYAHGQHLNAYLTEQFQRPTDCQAYNAPPFEGGIGDPWNYLDYPFLSNPTGGHECIESPFAADQVKTGPTEDTTPGGTDSEFTLVNGNYGFGDGCYDGTLDASDPSAPICVGGTFEALTKGDYIVEVDPGTDLLGRPKYKVVREEDINVFDGNQFTPQVPPPPCAGALHTVDVLGNAPDGPDATENPNFADGGGSPYEGQSKPLCDARLVPVQDGKSIAPSFFFFNDVPPPTRLFGAVTEDLALSSSKREFYYGEKAGVPNAPLGIYDHAMRPVYTVSTDPNGYYEVLLPSTGSYNCPLPAGPCPGMFRIIGNDPGQPGHPNANYQPQYNSLESDWQMWPGLTILSDVALVPISPVLEIPGAQTTHPPACDVEPNRPQLFAVSKPYGARLATFQIFGQHFGPSQGSGSVTIDGVPLTVTGWNDGQINVTVPNTAAFGPHQLIVTASSGFATINGLTFHVTGGTYTPTVLEVGPGKTYNSTLDPHAVQSALNAAAASSGNKLVVVYPNTPGQFTPLGDYYENIVMRSPVKLQGVGPGGVRDDNSAVTGSILNGLGFVTDRSTDWGTLIEGIRDGTGWSGNQVMADGEVVLVIAQNNRPFPTTATGYKPSIDGFSVTGGGDYGVGLDYTTQGGGIYVNSDARNLQITNNVVKGNGGAYGGAIRIGTPNTTNQHNDDIRISHNRLIANGGSNLAGAVGLFDGTNGYELDHNDVCGNFSAEYGGGISHFGLSRATTAHPVSSIHDNRVWFNRSYDEGGGIMVAGEPSTAVNPVLSDGSGRLDIYANVIQMNLGDDDGGGIRFLSAGNHVINAYNNIIANNVSAHEGGGVALDDTTNLRFFNNTVIKNMTTATAATSDGSPMPAGLSDSGNSALLQATLPASHAPYGDPLMFNNIFWDNRAGTLVSTGTTFTVDGIGKPGTGPIDLWDMGTADGSGPLHPTNTILNDTSRSSIIASASNKRGPAFDPHVLSAYDYSVDFLPWRGGAAFVFNILISADLPPGLLGDYHISSPSPAIDMGAPNKSGVNAPNLDIDGAGRPTGSAFDAGADEQPGPVTSFDTTGPSVSALAVSPNPTTNSTTLTGTASDVATGNSNVVAAEYYLGNSDPGVGLGTALSGTFGSPVAPLSSILNTSAWSNGANQVRVRARDAAGNWGPVTTISVTIDRAGPISVFIQPANNALVQRGSAVTVSALISDLLTGGRNVTAAEWFLDSPDPGAGSGTPMTGSFTSNTLIASGSIPGTTTTSLSIGNHTIHVRGRDALGNWGAIVNRTINVQNPLVVVMASDFESGTLVPPWSSVSGPTQVKVSAAAGMVDASGMTVTVRSNKPAFVTDRTPDRLSTYDARFYFDPHGAKTGKGIQTIFIGKSTTGKSLFQVQYRKVGSISQVRATLLLRNGRQKTTAWYRLAAGHGHSIELSWRASGNGSLRLFVDGAAKPTLHGNNRGFRLDLVRLGLVGSVPRHSAGTLYFDGFISTRNTHIGQ